MTDVASHRDHEWKKRGGCVYCVPCKVRLYHGDLPKDKKGFSDAYDDIIRAAERLLDEKHRKQR